jgi:hypothetical protein
VRDVFHCHLAGKRRQIFIFFMMMIHIHRETTNSSEDGSSKVEPKQELSLLVFTVQASTTTRVRSPERLENGVQTTVALPTGWKIGQVRQRHSNELRNVSWM